VILATITLCVDSERVFIVVRIYFVMNSVRKLLDTHSYMLPGAVDLQESSATMR
jgi:hypothetical protein